MDIRCEPLARHALVRQPFQGEGRLWECALAAMEHRHGWADGIWLHCAGEANLLFDRRFFSYILFS